MKRIDGGINHRYNSEPPMGLAMRFALATLVLLACGLGFVLYGGRL